MTASTLSAPFSRPPLTGAVAIRLGAIAITAALGLFSAGSTSAATSGTEVLPIEIQVDLLIDELSMKRESNDATGVIEVINKVRALEAPFPDFLYWVEAQALHDTGQLLQARDRILAYLKLAGRDGRFYRQASELLVTIAPEVETLERQAVEERRLRERAIAEAEAKARLLRTQNAQRMLDQLGYPVPITGNLDKETIEAVAVFQVRRDLTINGKITDEVLDTLFASVPDSHACDQLAHYSRDASDWNTVSLSAINANLAISECNDALRSYPDVVRFNIQYGRALAAAGRAPEALLAVEALAASGYPAAEFLIGELHSSGALTDNGRPDDEAALEQYVSAAMRGYARAQHHLGLVFESGNRAATRSTTEAFNWYGKAAEQGYGPALLKVAAAYESGRGVKRDYAKAMQWYERAAAANIASAQYALGNLFERGRGTKRDKVAALKWYRDAAANGHADAKLKVQRLDR